MSKRFNYAIQSSAGNIFSTSGNVGIGTTAPGERLSVIGNLQVGGSTQENYISFYGSYADNPSQFNHTYIGERIYEGIERSELLLFKGNDPDSSSGQDRIRLLGAEHRFDTYTSVLSGTFNTIGAGGTTRMIVTNNGNIGVGTTSPSNIFDVAGDPIFDDLELYPNRSGNNSYPVLQLSSNQLTGQTTGTIYSKIASRSWKGSSSGEFANDDVWIQVERQNITNPGDNFTHDAGLVIYTNSNNRDSQPTKRITINQNGFIVNSGNVGIGTSSPSSKLDVVGSIFASTNMSSANLQGAVGTIANLLTTNITAGTLRASTSLIATGSNNTIGSIWTSGGSIAINAFNSGTTSIAGDLHITARQTGGENNAILTLQPNSTGLFARGQCQIRAVHEGPLGCGAGLTFSTRNDSGGNFDPAQLVSEKMRISNAGNVGIGTATPATLLEVYGPEPASTLGTLLLTNNSSTVDTGISLVGRGNNILAGLVALGKIGMYKESSNNLTDSYITFSTNRSSDRGIGGTPVVSERMRITSLGYVGIGTNNPTATLDANGTVLSMNQSGWSTLAATSTASDRSATVMFTPTGTVTTANPQWFVGERYSANGPLSIWKYDGSSHQNNYVTIGTGGNVGIGTSSPFGKLHVTMTDMTSASVWNDGWTVFGQSAADGGAVGIGYNSNSGGYLASVSPGVAWRNMTYWGLNQIFHGGDAERMRITNTGNVGIGTSAPTYQLTLTGELGFNNTGSIWAKNPSGTYEAFLYPRWNDNITYLNYGSGGFNIRNNTGSTRMFMTDAGNVGIGTASPAHKLHISSLTTSANIIITGTPSNTSGSVGVYFQNDNAASSQTRHKTAILAAGAGDFGKSTLNFCVNNGNDSNSATLADTRMIITTSGNVGIGTTSPLYALDVVGAIRAQGTGGNLIVGNMLEVGNNLLNVRTTGNVGFGVASPTQPIDVNGWLISRSMANDINAKSATNAINTGSLIPTPSGSNIYQYWSDSGIAYRIISSGSTYFTGQHGNKPIDSQMDIKTNIENYVGLIVSSADEYFSTNPVTGEIATGKEAITISEALPKIKLTTLDQDKAVWGVVTNHKNDSFNTDGSFDYDNTTEFGDRLNDYTVRINGLGEGAIWVSNITESFGLNVNIDNGDYICSSSIPGYGRKQNDDLLHNYTVAKTTCSVNFDDSNLSERFRVRYLKSDGSIITEEQYNNYKNSNETTVYIAVFIGCTYHCS